MYTSITYLGIFSEVQLFAWTYGYFVCCLKTLDLNILVVYSWVVRLFFLFLLSFLVDSVNNLICAVENPGCRKQGTSVFWHTVLSHMWNRSNDHNESQLDQYNVSYKWGKQKEHLLPSRRCPIHLRLASWQFQPIYQVASLLGLKWKWKPLVPRLPLIKLSLHVPRSWRNLQVSPKPQ